jgi:hypothetical protein
MIIAPDATPASVRTLVSFIEICAVADWLSSRLMDAFVPVPPKLIGPDELSVIS